MFIFPCSTLWTMTFVSETLDKVSKLASKICICLILIFFENLQKVKPIIQKSVWWSFPNEKSDMKDLFIFPCSTSWTMTFVSETLKKWINLGPKSACFSDFSNFSFFWKSTNKQTDHSKKCGPKFSEMKIKEDRFLSLSVLYVVVYDIFIRDPETVE